MSAVLFGSISTVADTSELQRDAFNRAFEAHGLDWRWDRSDYLALLEKSGGRSRIAEYAQAHGQTVDAPAIHDTKSKIFQDSLAASALSARPGVVETIRAAKGQGLKVGLVTTTSPANIAALIEALGPDIRISDFDVVVDGTSVGQSKPNKAAYAFALDSLSEAAEDCIAVEDNVDGVRSAVAAGVTCVAFPNANTAEHDFGTATPRVNHLDFVELQQLMTGE